MSIEPTAHGDDQRPVEPGESGNLGPDNWPAPGELAAALAALDEDGRLDRINALIGWLVTGDEITRLRYRRVVVDEGKYLPAGSWRDLLNEHKKAQAVAAAQQQPADTPVDQPPAEPLNEQQLGTWSKGCPDIPDGFLIPTGWKCGKSGIHKVIERRDGEIIDIRVAYGAILPIATHIATNGEQFVELAWWDGIRWSSRMVPRSIAKSGKKLIAALGDTGLPAVEGNARDLEHWLAASESLNRRLIPEHKIARQLGWQPDGTFIASPDEARVETVFPEQEGALAAHRRHGTLEAWQKAVQHIETLPVAKLALYAGMAAPLLKVLRISSFTIDLSGRSTRGKTTAAKIGLSCWANPAADGDAMYTWQTTLLALEKRLNLVEGLPVVVDDTRVAKSPEDVDAALYYVSVGHGKPRAAPWPNQLPWSTIVISTGEQSALSFTTHQGASARVISVNRPPFGRDGERSKELAEAVDKGVDGNYGHAGPAFVERLQRFLAEDGGRDKLISRHAYWKDKLKGNNDLSARRSQFVAALALAAEMASRWDITPGLSLLKVDEWLDLVARENPTDDRPEMAIDAVREYVSSNSAAIWYPNRPEKDQPPGGWIGRAVDVDGGRTAVALLPLRLKSALARVNITLETVADAWKENGWLLKSGDKQRPYEPKRRLNGSLVRMYTFDPEMVGGSGSGTEDD